MIPNRILHITGKMDRAGAETMLMNLYRHMDHSLIQFDFMTFTAEEGDYDNEIIELGGKIIPILASNPIERMIKIQNFLKKNPNYKIVHSHTLLSNALHLLAAKGAGIKNRISHSHNTSDGKLSIIKKSYEIWALMVIHKISTHKIACGELAAKYLFGSSKGVYLLPNGVDLEKMMAVARESQNYFDKIFNDKGLKIVQIGRLNEVKNHQFSLKIAESLKNLELDFTIYFIGQGPLENSLKQQVRDMDLERNIKFLGVREDITELMASANFMIMPSLYEGFPVVLVESQAVGLRSIVSNKVSKEVDLGLGLVEFLSINSVEAWICQLSKLQTSKPKEQEIMKSLKHYGFDAATNSQKLSQFYKSL